MPAGRSLSLSLSLSLSVSLSLLLLSPLLTLLHLLLLLLLLPHLLLLLLPLLLLLMILVNDLAWWDFTNFKNKRKETSAPHEVREQMSDMAPTLEVVHPNVQTSQRALNQM